MIKIGITFQVELDYVRGLLKQFACQTQWKMPARLVFSFLSLINHHAVFYLELKSFSEHKKLYINVEKICKNLLKFQSELLPKKKKIEKSRLFFRNEDLTVRQI